MAKVLCTALSAETGPHFDLLRDAGFDCDVVPRDVDLWQSQNLTEQIQGYCGILAGSEPYTRDVLQAAPELRVLSRTGVGFDAIDLPTCDELNVVVATTPGVNHDSVAEHSIALLMGVARGFPGYHSDVANCSWGREARPRVQGSTIGLIGLGRIGQATAWRAAGLGMKVLACDPYAPEDFVREHGIEVVSLDELCSRSDYISLHSPVTPETKHLINADTIAKMKDGVVIINTARGALIREDDLVPALKSGKVRAAGLDVFETEPLPDDSPLLTLPNVLFSPHIAGLDNESHEATFAMAADTVIQLRDGRWPAERIQNLSGVSDWSWDR
jgi:phosphoglycerate dehydrogenase-like enzyme